MRIVIATVQVPFVRGGAELHAEGLRDALVRAGHYCEIVAIPFKWYPPTRLLDQIVACRLLDVTESEGRSVDVMIGLRFPAYLIPHPNKTLWILHQHRPAYDLWNSPSEDLARQPDGQMVRDAICEADKRLIPEARRVFSNSRNVAARLKRYCGVSSEPLYHPPPHASKFYCSPPEGYLFFPSRVTPNKRQRLTIEALAKTHEDVRIWFASSSDHPAYYPEMVQLARKLGVEHRIKWLGAVSEEEKTRLYAESSGVLYPPEDEDYGYVTLEAMLSSKPLITCHDSGGPLELVRDGETGIVVPPSPEPMAAAMDLLWREGGRASAMGRAANEHYRSLDITWDHVLEALLR